MLGQCRITATWVDDLGFGVNRNPRSRLQGCLGEVNLVCREVGLDTRKRLLRKSEITKRIEALLAACRGAQPVREIAQVADRGGNVPLFRWRMEDLRGTVAHRLDEIGSPRTVRRLH